MNDKNGRVFRVGLGVGDQFFVLGFAGGHRSCPLRLLPRNSARLVPTLAPVCYAAGSEIHRGSDSPRNFAEWTQVPLPLPRSRACARTVQESCSRIASSWVLDVTVSRQRAARVCDALSS